MKKSLMLFTLMLTLTVSADFNNAHSFSQTSSAGSSQNIQDMGFKEAMPAISGKVAETMDSGGYTYINVENNGKKTWVAVPQMKVKVGQNVSFPPGAVMENFKSKTLNRTFDTIIFTAGQGDAGAAATPAGPKKAAIPAVKPVKVEKASGSNAYTVAELYEKSAGLENKGIVVKGQVVKFSSNIMGKNWLHIQDGSGDSSKGTNDIIITTKDVASVGDIVTAKGTLYRNKDFGAGYKYEVIVEEAGIEK